MSRFTAFVSFLAFIFGLAAPVTAALLTPGDLITLDNAALGCDLVSPVNFFLDQHLK